MISKWITSILGDETSINRPVAKLLTGSGAAFVIGYLAKPIVLRLYTAEAFGIFEFIVALVAIAIPIASLRFEDALVLPESDEEARDVLLLSFLLSAMAVGLTALGVVFGQSLVPAHVAPYLWILPVMLAILRAGKLFELWLTRMKRFGRMSSAQVVQSSVQTGTRLAAGLGGGTPDGLLWSFVAGHAVGGVSNAWAAVRSIPRSGSVKLRAVAHRFRRFPIYSTPAALVAALSTRLPFVVLMLLFGAEVLGWFGQAFSILFVPLSLVGTSITQVFFVRAAEAQRAGSLTRSTQEAYRLLVGVSLVPIAVICAGAPDIFSFLFGDAWRTAGEYARLIGPWIGLAAIGSPLTRVFDVMERQRTDLFVNLVLFLCLSVGLVLAASSGEPVVGIAWVAVAGAIGRLWQITAALRSAGLSWSQIGYPTLNPLTWSLLLGLAVYSSTRFLSGGGVTGIAFLALLVWAPFLARRLTVSDA